MAIKTKKTQIQIESGDIYTAELIKCPTTGQIKIHVTCEGPNIDIGDIGFTACGIRVVFDNPTEAVSQPDNIVRCDCVSEQLNAEDLLFQVEEEIGCPIAAYA